MPAYSATAPAKIILFGEHAVVYGRPAIAVPVTRLQTRAVVMADPRAPAGRVRIQAPDIHLEAELSELPPDHPIAYIVLCLFAELGVTKPPAFTLRITSTIPVASGLGSGAAVSVASLRALSAFFGRPLEQERVSALAYQVEKLHHGSPSGIDNTVITYATPIYFVRGQPIEVLPMKKPITLVIGDTGKSSPTAIAVSQVRQGWLANASHYDQIFDQIAKIVRAAKQALEEGQLEILGSLMNQNQLLLQQLGVSSPELEKLITAAQSAGALGAKLSGAGLGGNMIALGKTDDIPTIAQAIQDAGASKTYITTI